MGVLIIVVINKIDKFGVNLECVISELVEYGVIFIVWGGEFEFVEILVKFGKNI